MPVTVFGKNRSPRISVVLPQDLLQKAKAHAKAACLPLSTLIRVALGEYIRRNEATDTVTCDVSSIGDCI